MGGLSDLVADCGSVSGGIGWERGKTAVCTSSGLDRRGEDYSGLQ